MQLNPGETFAIVRQLADPNDAGTYYVRATIRNARTDTLLATKDLTDRGGQRFSVEYQVPSSTSDALYIAISTRVYTNSGYTTLSTDYGQEIETYLVETRSKHFGGGGSVLKVDYEKIRGMIRESLDTLKFPETKQPKMPRMMSHDDIKSAMSEAMMPMMAQMMNGRTTHAGMEDMVRKAIASIQFPEQKETDLGPVLDAIGEIEVQPQVDFAPVIGHLKDQLKWLTEENIKSAIVDAMGQYAGEYKELITKIQDTAVKSVIASHLYPTAKKAPAEEGKPTSPFEGRTIPELIKMARERGTP